MTKFHVLVEAKNHAWSSRQTMIIIETTDPKWTSNAYFEIAYYLAEHLYYFPYRKIIRDIRVLTYRKDMPAGTRGRLWLAHFGGLPYVYDVFSESLALNCKEIGLELAMYIERVWSQPNIDDTSKYWTP